MGMLPRLEPMLVLPQFKDQQFTWLTVLMLPLTRPDLLLPLLLLRLALMPALPQLKDQLCTWLTVLMLLLTRLALPLPSLLLRLEPMPALPQLQWPVLTWLTVLMLLLPRQILLLPLLLLRLVNMLLLLPSQLSLFHCQLSQPTLLHSMVDSMVAITMDSTHTLMEPPTHMPMEDTHMPLLHMPLLSQQLKNKRPALADQDTIKNAKPFEKMKKELGSFKDPSTISSPKK